MKEVYDKLQIFSDVTFLISIFAGLSSALSGLYLLHLWRKQSTRIMTDLPLLFGAAFVGLGFNLIVMGAMNGSIIPDTFEIFRFRTLVFISASVVPLFFAVMHIWLSRYNRYFSRVLLAIVLYWSAVSLLGPSREIIMILLIPLMLVFIAGIAVTFSITWKTGRLKEVRSDFLVISSITMILSQIVKLALNGTGLEYLADLLSASGTFIAAVGLANPWYRRSTSKTTDQQQSVTNG